MRVGVLTGGGDCPGLNAVIRAVVRRGTQEYVNIYAQQVKDRAQSDSSDTDL